MTEDLVTDLSKISSLCVIARNSSFTFKGRAVDVREAARTLGARAFLAWTEMRLRRYDEAMARARLCTDEWSGAEPAPVTKGRLQPS